jgi:hypothetical protein
VTELELERALTDLAGHLEHPPTPPLAEAVLARLTTEPAAAPSAGRRRLGRVAAPAVGARLGRVAAAPGHLARVTTGPLGRWLRGGPAWRRVAVAALALIVLATGIVVATPGAREAVARRLGIPGVAIHLGEPAPTTAPPTGTSAPASPNLALGRRVTLEEARRAVSFGLLVPSAAGFRRPDAVYLSRDVPGGRVDFVYRPRPGLPASRFTDAGLLITQFRAEPMVEKFAKTTTELERVTVAGEVGYWFAGGAHAFGYLDRNGIMREETSRLAGSTLVWSHHRLTLRLEGQVTKAEALRIATSMR